MLKRIQLAHFSSKSKEITIKSQGPENIPSKPDERAKYLNIYLPSTDFKSRYCTQKTERELSLKMQADLRHIWSEKVSKGQPMKTIFDPSVRLLPNGDVPIGEMVSKVLADIEWKFRLLKDDPVAAVCGFNVFNEQFVKDKQADLGQIKASLSNYLSTMARWGIYIDSNLIYVTFGKIYFDFVFDLFHKLMSQKLIYERESSTLFSVVQQRELREHEYKVIRSQSKHQVCQLKVLDVGEQPILGLSLELTDIHFLVTIRELASLPLISAVSLHELKTYIIFEMEKKVYVCQEDFFNGQKFFRDKSIKVIAKVPGNRFTTWVLDNPLNQSEPLSIISNSYPEPGSGFIGLCPILYRSDLRIFQNNGLSFATQVDEGGKVMVGLTSGLEISQLESIVQQNFKGNFLDGFMIVEPVEHYISNKNEERLFFLQKVDYYLKISNEIKDETLNALEEIQHIGPKEGVGFPSIENGIKRFVNDIQISGSGNFGLPIPVLKGKKGRGKIICNGKLIEEFKKFFTEKGMAEFKDADLKEIMPQGLNIPKHNLLKETRIFSPEFLKIASFLFVKEHMMGTAKSDDLQSVIQPSDESNWALALHQNVSHVDLKYPFEMTCLGVDQNETYLARSLLLQMLTTSTIGVSTIKSHALLVDEEDRLLHNTSQTITDGLTADKTVVSKSIGHGSDCFRLYAAYVDIPNSPYTNLLFRSEQLVDKNSEINIIRTIFWELLRFINPEVKVDDCLKDQHALPEFERLILCSLRAFAEVVDKAYEEKNYSQVYAAYVDFMKYTVYDLFIAARKQLMISSHFSLEAKHLQNTAAKIIDVAHVLMAPILPFNAESIHQAIKHNTNKKNSIFEEPWPLESLKAIQFERASLEKLETLRSLKEAATSFYNDEKKKYKEKSNFTSRKYHLTISLNCSPRRLEFEKILSRFRSTFEPLVADLHNILECTTVSLMEEKIEYVPKYKDEYWASMLVDGERVKLRVVPSKIKNKLECQRCFLLTRIDNSSQFCEVCQRYINPGHAHRN